MTGGHTWVHLVGRGLVARGSVGVHWRDPGCCCRRSWVGLVERGLVVHRRQGRGWVERQRQGRGSWVALVLGPEQQAGGWGAGPLQEAACAEELGWEDVKIQLNSHCNEHLKDLINSPLNVEQSSLMCNCTSVEYSKAGIKLQVDWLVCISPFLFMYF